MRFTNDKALPNELVYEILQLLVEQPVDPTQYVDHRPSLRTASLICESCYGISRKLLSRTIIIQIQKDQIWSLKRQLSKILQHFRKNKDLLREVRRLFILSHSWITSDLPISDKDAKEISIALYDLLTMFPVTMQCLDVGIPTILSQPLTSYLPIIPAFQNIRVLSFGPMCGSEDEDDEHFRRVFRLILESICGSTTLKELKIYNIFFPALEYCADFALESLIVKDIRWEDHTAPNYFSKCHRSLKHLEVSATSFLTLQSATNWIIQFHDCINSLHINFQQEDEDDINEWIGTAILPPMTNLQSLKVTGDGDLEFLPLFPSLLQTSSLKHLHLIDVSITSPLQSEPGFKLYSFVMQVSEGWDPPLYSKLESIINLVRSSRESLRLFAIEEGCVAPEELKTIYKSVNRTIEANSLLYTDYEDQISNQMLATMF